MGFSQQSTKERPCCAPLLLPFAAFAESVRNPDHLFLSFRSHASCKQINDVGAGKLQISLINSIAKEVNAPSAVCRYPKRVGNVKALKSLSTDHYSNRGPTIRSAHAEASLLRLRLALLYTLLVLHTKPHLPNWEGDQIQGVGARRDDDAERTETACHSFIFIFNIIIFS